MPGPPTRHRKPAKDLLGLLVFVAVCLAVSGIGGAITATSVGTWYQTLQKPPFNPPDWVFAPVWTALYLLMAVAGWRAWRGADPKAGRLALVVFAVQLGLNLAWSFLFFGLRSSVGSGPGRSGARRRPQPTAGVRGRSTVGIRSRPPRRRRDVWEPWGCPTHAVHGHRRSGQRSRTLGWQVQGPGAMGSCFLGVPRCFPDQMVSLGHHAMRGGQMVSLGHHAMRGVDTPQEIFTLIDHND